MKVVKKEELKNNIQDVTPEDVSIKDLPKENVWKIESIPSNFKGYTSKNIFGRPLTVKEIKQLASLSPSNADYVINQVIRSAIKGIEIEDIYLEDKLYIVYWLRAQTYRSPNFVLDDTKCDHCQAPMRVEFSIEDLSVQEAREDFKGYLEVALEDGRVVRLDFMRIRDELMVEAFKKRNSNSLQEFDNELLNLASMVKSIDGIPCTSLLRNYDFVDGELTPMDFARIMTILGDYKFGHNGYIDYTCKKCGGQTPIGVSFRPDFFIPKYSDNANT